MHDLRQPALYELIVDQFPESKHTQLNDNNSIKVKYIHDYIKRIIANYLHKLSFCLILFLRIPNGDILKAIGVDIIEIERIQLMTNKYGLRFLRKIFTERELDYCRLSDGSYRVNSLAARFAAKEAFYKAANQIVKQTILWHDCEIINNKNGTPQICFNSNTINELMETTIHLSLSHSCDYAIAFVVIE